MEAQAIFPARADDLFKRESAEQGMADAFQAILRENEERDLAARNEMARRDVPRDRVEREAEREAIAQRQSDAMQETRSDDRYGDRRDERPEAADIQAADRSDRGDRGDQPDESQPRSDLPGQNAESATAEIDTQGDDVALIAGGAPAEIGQGGVDIPNLADPFIAAVNTLAENPTAAALPATQAINGAVALQLDNSKDTLSNAPRPAIIPASVTGPQAGLDDTVARPALGGADIMAAVKANQNAVPTVPAVPAEAGIPINAAQVNRTHTSGQKIGAQTASTAALELVGIPGKEKQAPTAAVILSDRAGQKSADNAPSLVNGPAPQSNANQVGRVNAVQLPQSLANPGQRATATSDTVTDVLKTTAPASNTSQSPAALTGFDPMQVAARSAGGQPGAAPAMDRPVPPSEVAVTIQRAIARGEDRIRIRLHPAELGQIEVRLKVGADGIVRAVVQVDRPETLDLLNRDSRGLERALQDAGLKTDTGSLSFNLRNNGEDGLQDRDDDDTSMAGQEAEAKSLVTTDAAEIPAHTRWSNRVLDIRV